MKKIITLFFATFFAMSVNAQVPQDFTFDHAECGTSPEAIDNFNDVAWGRVAAGPNDPFTPIGTFPAGGIVTCGRFKLYFEDFAFNEGFFDPANGANRRNTFCAVVTYVQSVLSMQNITNTNQYVDVHVRRSYTPLFPAPNQYGALAVGGPYYPANYSSTVNNTAGIFNGFAYDHITTGNDPDATAYDCVVRVNFHQVWIQNVYYTHSYWDQPSSLNQKCVFDLYSVLLHEVTHGLGWISNINEDSTNPNLPIKSAHNTGSNNNHQFTRYDNVFLHFNNANNNLSSTANFDKLIINGPAINTQVNTNNQPIRFSKIWLYNNNRPLNQPVYSGDYVFMHALPQLAGVPASFLSHLNEQLMSFTFTQRISPGFSPLYVMGPFMNIGEQKRLLTFQEIRALLQLGYTANPSYVNLNTVQLNTPANYLAGQFTEYVQGTGNSGFPEGAMPNILTLANNSSGVSLNIDLFSNINLMDANGDPIRV
jgi:hypothetical protein